MVDIEKLKFPVGKFKPLKAFDDKIKTDCISAIASFPKNVRNAIEQLSADELKMPYRPGGWTIHQLVHHCADSHMNAYFRFKLALTEETPTIKPYDQEAWAKTADVAKIDADISIAMLDALHTRWTALLNAMDDEDFEKPLHHPELKRDLKLDFMLQMYGWHSRHHLGHITEFIKRRS